MPETPAPIPPAPLKVVLTYDVASGSVAVNANCDVASVLDILAKAERAALSKFVAGEMMKTAIENAGKVRPEAAGKLLSLDRNGNGR